VSSSKDIAKATALGRTEAFCGMDVYRGSQSHPGGGAFNYRRA